MTRKEENKAIDKYRSDVAYEVYKLGGDSDWVTFEETNSAYFDGVSVEAVALNIMRMRKRKMRVVDSTFWLG